MGRRRALLLATIAWPAAVAAQPFTLEALLASLAAVPAREAAFEDVRWFRALNEPLRSSGRLRWDRPDRLEVTTDWPQPSRLLVAGDQVTTTEGLGPARTLSLAQAPPELGIIVAAIRAPLAGDAAALRRDFEPSLTGAPAGWSLVLTPRAERIAAMLRRVTLTGDGAEPRRVELLLGDGDRQVLTIDATR